MVDEADIDPMGAVRGSGGTGAGGKRGSESPRAAPPKRKAGPLPPHIVARRPSMPAPVVSPPVTPVAPLSPVTRPASPLAPVPSELPSGRPPEVFILENATFLYIFIV